MTVPATAAGRGSAVKNSSNPFLRFALKLDAVVTSLNGLGYLVAATLLDDVFDLSAGLLRGVGIFLLVFGILVWVAGSQSAISRRAVGVIIAVNLIWTLDSLVIAATGFGDPSTVARVWIAMQGVIVGLFAVLQIAGLRRRS